MHRYDFLVLLTVRIHAAHSSKRSEARWGSREPSDTRAALHYDIIIDALVLFCIVCRFGYDCDLQC